MVPKVTIKFDSSFAVFINLALLPLDQINDLTSIFFVTNIFILEENNIQKQVEIAPIK